MMAGRPLTLAARATPAVVRRRPGIAEALLLVLVLVGKITFWIPVPFVPINLAPLALALLVLVHLAFSFRLDNLVAVLQSSILFAIGAALVLTMLLAALGLKATPYYNFSRVILVIYMFVSIYVAALIFADEGSKAFQRVAAWAGPILAVYFMFMLLLAHGYDPGLLLNTLMRGIESGNPSHFTFHLTNSLVAGTSELEQNEFGRNVRHGWSGALLVGLLMSAMFIKHRGDGRAAAVLWLGLVGLNVLILVMLMSRGVLVGALVGVLASLLLPGPGRGLQLGAMLAGGIVLGIVLAVSGLGELLYQQFFASTGSYTGRLTGIENSFRDIDQAILFGVERPPAGISAHNWIIDLWRGSGIVGAVGGLLMLAYFAVATLRLLLLPPPALLTDPHQRVLGIVFVTAGAFVCVRYLTSGFGIIGSQEALAAGIFIALAHRFRLQAASPPAAPTAAAVPQGRPRFGGGAPARWRPPSPS